MFRNARMGKLSGVFLKKSCSKNGDLDQSFPTGVPLRRLLDTYERTASSRDLSGTVILLLTHLCPFL